MEQIRKSLLVGAAMAGIFLASAPNASAAVACVGPVCWHSPERYEYPPDANVTVHPDDWRWGKDEHYSWREHEGRGYWKGDRFSFRGRGASCGPFSRGSPFNKQMACLPSM
jgi:hypothetical protein